MKFLRPISWHNGKNQKYRVVVVVGFLRNVPLSNPQRIDSKFASFGDNDDNSATYVCVVFIFHLINNLPLAKGLFHQTKLFACDLNAKLDFDRVEHVAQCLSSVLW